MFPLWKQMQRKQSALELIAGCVALHAWKGLLTATCFVLYCDNVKFALIRGLGLGQVAKTILQLHWQSDLQHNTNSWFARVPTEANIADIPSRMEGHSFLFRSCDDSSNTFSSSAEFLKEIRRARIHVKKNGEECYLNSPHVSKRSR